MPATEPTGAPALADVEARSRLKEYVDRWKTLGPLLEEQREKDVRQSETMASIRCFNGLFENALAARGPLATSGLVEQQRLFMLLRDPNKPSARK